jgi:hypothetical protein
MQDGSSNHAPKGLTLDERNVGRAYPAIMEMDGVRGSIFGELSDSQGKRE